MTTEVREPYVLRVAANSPPQSVASSIHRCITDEGRFPVIRAIGAGAVAQACKAIAIARGLVAPKGMDLVCIIGFETVVGTQGTDISAQTFILFAR